jgi:quercetin 2,3-dioxygenase
MSFEYLIDPAKGPQRKGVLPGKPQPYVPRKGEHFAHAYEIEEAARLMGTLTGGFERFYQHMGTETDHPTKDPRPFVQDFPGMGTAAQVHNMEYLRDFDWSGTR